MASAAGEDRGGRRVTDQTTADAAIAPAVFTVSSRLPFADALAAGVLHRMGADADPLVLARATLLLPTRRSCRAVRDAFLRASNGRPMILPRMVPIGDVDEEMPDLLDVAAATDADLPPAIPALRRRLLLTRLILQWSAARAAGDARAAMTADQAARLAEELARLIDQTQTERLSFDRLADLVPAEFALHWQSSLEFLSIVTTHWPALRAEIGGLDPAERRDRVLAARAKNWENAPPTEPIIAAGTTGSIPATADLLCVVARLPNGCVVLPGLDQGLDEDSWHALEPSHAQYGLKELLVRLGVERADVRVWPESGAQAAPIARSVLLSEAMRPAPTTDQWPDIEGLDESALAGITRIDCPTNREEAAVIALIMRETLEAQSSHRTAALVTPDRALARRVAAEMRRWSIVIDDSAGTPLADTPPGNFLRLTARMVATRAAPVPLLAALKHPFAAGGLAAPVFRAHVRALERSLLRGPRRAPGFDTLVAALAAHPDLADRDGLLAWAGNLAALARELATMLAGRRHPPREFLRAHIGFAEQLARTDKHSGADRLWRGDAGEAAAAFVAELDPALDTLEPIGGASYPSLLEALMAGKVVRPRFGTHPRLAILGPLEARLQRFDVMILAGLNEGTWPMQTEVDPWLSRPMRAQFGLPQPERRIGQAAHDFQQAFCAGTVVLTRAERVDGSPTVPSRWLTRLATVLKGAKIDEKDWTGGPWLGWQRQLDRVESFGPRDRPRPPAPRPPLAARPRRLSVTQIETWMRDPYAIYARHILRLKALDPLDAPPDAAQYGTLIHQALAEFIADHRQGPLASDALSRLLATGSSVFAEVAAQPGVWAFWWPRFERIARWFITAETARRRDIVIAAAELRGELTIDAPGGPFTLSSIADRIDNIADRRYAIIDYKTGAVPSQKEVAAGFAPQLPLEAAIARGGGFAGLGEGAIAELAYWRLGGGNPAGEIRDAGADPNALAAQALEGLGRLVAQFDDPATPYACRPRADMAPRYSDYEHLARVKEWAPGERRSW